MELEIGEIGWFILLWGGVLVISIFAKSLILNIGLIIGSVWGYGLARSLIGVSEEISIGLAVVFLMGVVLAVMEILLKVREF